MKRMMKTWALVAVAAMGLTACQNDIDEQIEAKDSVVVTFVTDSAESRTSVDTSGEKPVFSWDDEGESFAVLEQTSSLAKATSVTFTKDEDGKAQIEAEIPFNAGQDGYSYVTIHPEKGFVADKTTIITSATLYLPENQYMYEVGTYDSEADLIVSQVVDTDAQPTEAQYVSFTRLGAVVKMTLKNFALEADDEIEKVIFTADGKNLAGNITADLCDPHNFTAVDGEVSSSVTVSTNPSTNKATDIYFVTLPTVLAAGDTYTVTVITSTKIYMKNGTIPAEKELKLGVGAVNRFGVDMSTSTVSDKWVLVTDASTLAEGDVVAIVAKDYDKALSSKLYSNASETSTSAKRDAADVSKFGNYLIDNEEIQRLVLVTGTVENTFSFYDEARDKFLVSTTKTGTNLINQVYCNENTSFAITIDAGTAAATITNTAGSYVGNLLRYNTNDYFVSNQNSSNVYKDVCIYRLDGVKGNVPTVAANITVPDADESVVIAEEGTATATAIESVVFNYVGSWNISVTSSESWLKPSYADGKLYYTADENTSSDKRNATVTITATLEGEEALTWTFTVTQKGAPKEITIEEFAALAKDVDSTYKLTGKVVTLATNATSNGYFLEDENGNQVEIEYLDTEEGENVWGHDTLSIQLGDIMTVTAVPMGSKKGGSSSYPSIYKGHYGISASVGVAAEYTGGDVNITVETYSNGNVTAPATVAGTMAECDYATFTYSGGESATISFTSENTTSAAREATATFTYGLASVTIIAEQSVNPANRVGWNLVTDASTLAVGDEIVIVALNADKALGCLASTAVATSVSNFPAVEVDKSAGVVYDVDKAGAVVFTLCAGNSDGTFALQFTHNDKDYYLYAPSSGLKGRTASSEANAVTSYEITIDSDTGNVTMENGQPKVVKFNGATGTTFLSLSPTAANASKSEYAVSIYKK